jgi:L-fuconolactonase
VSAPARPPGSAVAARAVDEAWLSRYREDVLEPALPIVDAHHHVWRRPGSDYGVDDYLSDAHGHALQASVFIECTSSYRAEGPDDLKPLGEAEFACGLAREAEARADAPCVGAGFVGYADMGLGAALEPVLHGHLAIAGGRFKGVRNSVAWHADDAVRMMLKPPKRPIEAGMLGGPAMREGVALLGRMGLSFDVWLYHTQLDELTALAHACPDTPLIVNHLGGLLGCGVYDERRELGFAEWREAIARLAVHPNVWLKFGGLGMRVSGLSQGPEERSMPASSIELAAAWRPCFDVCMQSFGPGRCMFESNFPMDKATMRYGTLWNTFKRLTAGFGAAERDALLRSNAARVYRLDLKEE